MIEASDHLAILALYAEYNRAIDAGDHVAWALTFTEDGVFDHPSRAFTGRLELEQFVRERTAKLATHPCQNQRHWNDAIRLDGQTGEVIGSCDLVVSGVERESGRQVIVAQARYSDVLAKISAQWRFKRRVLRLV